MVLLVVMLVLAEHFGLESILGAFMAGALVGLPRPGHGDAPTLPGQVEAIGYGFLIPVFFVSSGVRLDISGLVEDPGALSCACIRRGTPRRARPSGAALPTRPRWHRDRGRRRLQATSLPFIVTATMIGVETGLMAP